MYLSCNMNASREEGEEEGEEELLVELGSEEEREKVISAFKKYKNR